jgi:hypothetical protein
MTAEDRLPPEREGYRYPLVQSNERSLDPEYGEELYLCDIDNTYLITHYKTLRDFIRLAMEPAQDKRPVPGAPALMKAIRHGAEGSAAHEGSDPKARRALYFVSASPESMRKVLEKRLLIDEVEFDGASFRDLWAGKTPHLRHIRDIYGYKVAALLTYRLGHPKSAQEILFGDDLEFDAEVYVLYSKICAGTIRGEALDGVLETRGLLAKDRKYIVAIADELPEYDPVKHIFIRKVRAKTAKEQESSPFESEDSRVHIFADYLQAGLFLYAKGHIHSDALASIAFDVDTRRSEDDEWLPPSIDNVITKMTDDEGAKIDQDLRDKIEQGLLKLKIIASSEQGSDKDESVAPETHSNEQIADEELKGEGHE